MDNILHITKIVSFFATNGKFVISQLFNTFIVSLVPYLLSTFLLVSLFYFSFTDTYHIYLHIFLHLLSLLATSNFLSLTLSFYIVFHILLLVYHSVTILFPLLTPYSLVYTLFLYLYFLNSSSIDQLSPFPLRCSC